MRHLRGGAVALLAAGALALSTAVSADPAIEITSPKDGSTVARSGPTVPVTGTARFDAPVDTTRRFYARRASCGAAGGDNERLSTYRPANEGGNGCGLLASGLPFEVLHATGDDETGYVTLPAVDGLPAALRDGTVAGKLVFSGYRGAAANPAAVHVGIGRLEVQLLANEAVAGSTVVERTLTPTTPSVEYTFEFPVAQAACSQPRGCNALALRFRMRGVTALNGFLTVNGGASYVDVPVKDLGSVLVSTDPGFPEGTTQFPSLSTTGAWTARLMLPPGEHTVYARAVQGDKTAEAATTFTLQ